MTEIIDNFDEFISKPTNISKSIILFAKKAEEKYSYLIKKPKFKDKIKLRLLYLNKYSEIYKYCCDYNTKNDFSTNIISLFKEIEEIFGHIALNNILLSYSFITEKNLQNPIITKEDQKLDYLKKLYNKEINIDSFIDKFGHYAINGFELSSRRFSEFSKEELLKIGSYLKSFKIKKNQTLEQYLKDNKKILYPIYATLKEELKYIALLVINKIHFKLKEIQKKNKIKNIFNLSYDDLQRKNYSK